MTESLLQYIWQTKNFQFQFLQTTTGEAVQILDSGTFNKNQGPDFLNARLKIGAVVLVGSVELHVNAKNWVKHKHEEDLNYKNVVLHIVWEQNESESSLPVLEIKNYVPKILLKKYEQLMNSKSFIACEKSIQKVENEILHIWIEKLIVQRLIRKASAILAKAKNLNYNWNEIFWQLLAKSFGLKQNEAAFEALAEGTSINILAKNKNSLLSIEALLFGQSGLLQANFIEGYPRSLSQAYQFLQHKYFLRPIPFPIHFLRMRPPNFPTIRLAQLAMLIFNSSHLFSKIIEATSLQDVKKLFQLNAGEYWETHYLFDQPSEKKSKTLGDSFINIIITNTVCPVLFAYAGYMQNEVLQEKALAWLQNMNPEKNSIIDSFKNLGIKAQNAYESQALLELKNEYCSPKRCLECMIGSEMLRNN